MSLNLLTKVKVKKLWTVFTHYLYRVLAGVSCVAGEIKKFNLKKKWDFWKCNRIFLAYAGYLSVPSKMPANLVQPIGQL